MIKKRVLSAIIISSLLLFASCAREVENGKVVQNPPPKNTETTKTPPANPSQDQKGGEQNKTEENKTEENKTNPPPNVDISKLSNAEKGWYFNPNKTHNVPGFPAGTLEMLKNYSAYYVGDTSSKVIYLTFDEGYENGYSGKILDILKANDVPAAFFVTRPYINQNKDLINRMVNEGHVVGNHTSTHPSMPTKTGNAAAFEKEFKDTEAAFQNVTGKDMPKFFRPPMGMYSEKSLYMTQELGYKTIFWSFAHKDWLVNDQPSVQAAHDKVLLGSHNGAIYLLHAVSKSNTEALDSIIKDLKAQGYRFAPLTELK